MSRLAFNINEYVYIRVKPEGFAHWKALDDEYLSVQWQRPLSDYTKQEGPDGYVRMQMHEFMRVFGYNLSLGFNPVFHTDILFDAKALVPHE